MAQIPIIQDTATLDVGEGRQRVRASGDAFGAAQADGMAALARGVEQVALVAADKEDEFAEAEAQSLDNQLAQQIRARLYNTNDGYLSTQRGRNAIDGRAQVEADLDEMAVTLGSSASPRARRLYDDLAQRRVTGALGDVATYAARQNTQYLGEQIEAGLNEDIDNAVAAYHDEVQVAASVGAGIGRIERLAELHGWSEDTTRDRIRQYQSDINQRIVVALAASDPEAAQTYYDRIRPTLSAQDAGELLTTMRAVQAQEHDRLEGLAWQQFANNRPLQAMGTDEYQRFTSDPRFGAAHARLRDAYRVRAQAYASGAGRVRDNSPAYIAGILEADRNPDAFTEPGALEAFIAEHADSISGSDMVRLLSRRRDMIEGADAGQSVQAQQQVFNALRGVAAATLRPHGLVLRDGNSSDRSRAAAFDAALQRETARWLADNQGRPPQGDDVQMVIGRAVVAMNADDLRSLPAFRRSRRGQSAVVPYAAIPADRRAAIEARLRAQLRRDPTEPEVEGFYASYLSGEPSGRVAGEIAGRAGAPN